MTIDKDKKEKIDQILLNNIFRDTDDLNNSNYIWKMCKSVSDLAFLDWGEEDVFGNCILALYETAIKNASEASIDDIGNKKFMVSTYKYAKIMANKKSICQHRYDTHNKEWNGDKIISYDTFEKPEEWFIKKDSSEFTKPFIYRWFLDNQYIFNKGSKFSKLLLDYIEHPYPRDRVTKNGKVLKGSFNLTTDIRKRIFSKFNKQYSKRLNAQLTWRKQKFTPEQQQQWEEQYSLIIDAAEILSYIDTIDIILNSDHIGKEFNKHKDIPLLFNMFYDNISAASRRSINKEYYSNDSILELKSNLENQKNKLINKLHKKEVELNDINSKATFNK